MSTNLINSYFKLEPTSASAKITGVHESLLQEAEKDILWYRDNFLGKGTVFLNSWLNVIFNPHT